MVSQPFLNSSVSMLAGYVTGKVNKTTAVPCADGTFGAEKVVISGTQSEHSTYYYTGSFNLQSVFIIQKWKTFQLKRLWKFCTPEDPMNLKSQPE
jgi:hypothetical protein